MCRFNEIELSAEREQRLPRHHRESEDADAQWLHKQRKAMDEGSLCKSFCDVLTSLLERYSKSFWWERFSAVLAWVTVAKRLPVQHGSKEEDTFAQWLGYQSRSTTVLSASQREALREITEVWPSSAELRWIRAGVLLRSTGEWKRSASLRAQCVQKVLKAHVSEAVAARFFGRGGLWHPLMGNPLQKEKSVWPHVRLCRYLACIACVGVNVYMRGCLLCKRCYLGDRN